MDILYAVTSDRDTPVNMTNHAYFNLGGHASGSVLDTRIQILADSFTPTDADSIPTGEILAVEGTPMDFGHRRPSEQTLTLIISRSSRGRALTITGA